MIGRTLAMAMGLLGGLAASQAPEFAQQYRQRLGGAVDELRRVVTRFDESARASGLTREQAVARLAADTEPLVKRQADATAAVADRLGRLERQRQDLVEAGPFGRLLVMARDADHELARATYLDYEPALPATAEGAAAGAIGFVAGWLGVLFLSRIVSRLRPRPRAGLRSA